MRGFVDCLKSVLPGRCLLLLIVVLSLINPLHYVIFSLSAPEGRVFVGHVDDVLQLTVFSSASWGFQDPWGTGTFFENPVIGAPFTYAILGTPFTLMGINSLALFLVLKFVAALALLVVLYNFLRFFLKDGAQMGFALLLLSAGVGWILYGASALLFGQPYTPLVGYMFTSEFDELGGGAHMLSHLTRIYWIIPEITGFAAMLLFFRNRRALAGIMLGLTWLFYPLFGLAFSAFVALYALVSAEGRGLQKIRQAVVNVLPTALIAVPFAAAWAYIYASSPTGIELYRSIWQGFGSRPLLTLLVSSLFAATFAGYGYLRKEKRQLLVLAALAVLFVPFTLANIYEVASTGTNGLAMQWLSATGIDGVSQALWQNSLALEVAFFALFAALCCQVYRRFGTGSYPFLWLLLVAFMASVSARWVPWWPARFGWFFLFPAVIAAVPGIKAFAHRHNLKRIVTPNRIVLGIILLSLPSLIAFNVYFNQVAYSSDLPFIEQDDYAAIQFIKTQPEGRVLAWYPIGQLVPYYTGKTSVIFAPHPEQKTEDVREFYSSASEERMQEIIDRYGIEYVFLGEHEKNLGASDFDGIPFLDKIFDGTTRVYMVK